MPKQTAAQAQPQTLCSLQALRGIAALGVVLFHLLPFESKYLVGPTFIPAGFAAGRAGVDLFFVLSGFFFTWTTTHSPGGPAEAVSFLLRRLTRIYPPYWLVCSLLIVMYLVGNSGGAENVDMASSLLLLPTARPTLLLVSWTLVFEVYFYLVFALVLSIGQQARWRLALLSLWVACALIARLVLVPGREQTTLDLVSSPLILEFVIGCLAAQIGYASSRYFLKPGIWCIALSTGVLSMVAAISWTEFLFANPWWRVCAFGLSTSTILFGCIGTETHLRRLIPKTLILIGDASYSLYLSHLLTIGVVGWLCRHTVADGSAAVHFVALTLAVVASVTVSVAAHRLVEKPLLRALRQLGGQVRRISRMVTA